MTQPFIRPLDDAETDRLRREFDAADPFPHLVIDDLLTPEGLAEADQFPDVDWPHWTRFGDEYQRGKMYCNDIAHLPEAQARIIRECCEPRFLRALEKATGIEKLIPDPYLSGGGLHSTGEGGVLAPHTDFHVYRDLDLYRYINLIIYLTPGMKPENGGQLEFYRKGEKQPSKTVPARFGRCVIFRTDDQSVHGFLNPVTGVRRNSIALYYYRSAESAGFAGDLTTHWQQHGDAKGVRGVRLAAYHALLYVSRAFSKLAHLANPNLKATGAITRE